jgi:hypothetical protein
VAWAALFGYLMVDDAFEIHERAGDAIARHLEASGAWGVVDQQVAEALTSAVMGGLALVVIGLLHARSDAPTRRASWRLLRLIALLAVLGVAVDVLHEQFEPGAWHTTLGVVEEGGEMAVMTAAVWLAASLHATTCRSSSRA